MDPPAARRRCFGEDIERLQRHCPIGVGVVIDVDPVDVGLALVPFKSIHVVLDGVVHVDRPLVHEDLRREQVDFTEDSRPVGCRVDDHHVLRGRRPERDLRRREVLGAPVPAAVLGLADVAGLGDEGEELVGDARTEHLARLERQLERGASKMGDQDVQVVRIEARLLDLAAEQELRVADDVPVDRRARRDEDPDADPAAPPRPPDLLPRRRDGARIPGQDRHVEAADVDAELERVRRDDAEDLAVTQALLDRPPLRREVTAAIPAHSRARSEVLAEGLAERREHDLDCGATAAEHDGLATGPQERQRPAVGDRLGGAASPGRAVEEGRLDEQDVALTRWRSVAIDEDRRPAGQRRRELGWIGDRR